MCHRVLLTACEQDQCRTAVPSWSCLQAVSKPVWHIPLLCVQWKTPDSGQRNCPKHVEFYSKNKFEKLVNLVGFIVRIYHDARSPERQKLVIPFQGLSPAWMKNCCFFFEWVCCVRRVDDSAGKGEGASSVMKWVATRHTKRQDAWRTIFSLSSRPVLICMFEFP